METNVVRLAGGLGNQMFQYAFGQSLSEKFGLATEYDLRLYSPNSLTAGDEPREFGLGALQTNLVEIPKNDLDLSVLLETNGVKWKFFSLMYRFGLTSRSFRPKVIEQGFDYSDRYLKSASLGAYFEGYWQSPKYFKEISPRLVDEFTPSISMSTDTVTLQSHIRNQRSLCVNVRRGDFAANPKSNKFHGALSSSYYSHAVEVIRQKYKFDEIFVFSDDPAWCKNNLNLGKAFEVVEHEHAGPHFSHYLELMKASSAFVIPNSTFGWWGAWLSGARAEIVVAPKAWFRSSSLNMKDLIPESWLRV